MNDNRHAAHTIYKNAVGKRVPGTTSISGVLDKSRFLVPWANRLGLEGIDSSKYVDEKARAGTLAHEMILADFAGNPPPDLAAFTQYEIDQAENSFLKALEWKKRHTIVPVLSEAPLVSEVYQFGGKIDLYCGLDDVPTLLDLKTSKAIYDEHWIQVGGGYNILLIEHGHVVIKTTILQVGRDENEGFSEESRTDLEDEKRVFIHCRAIYDLMKTVRYKGETAYYAKKKSKGE